MNVFSAVTIFNPHNYPQTCAAGGDARFHLRVENNGLSSAADRSRLVLPNVTIAKVRLAWM
jgi:hypothetical protein